jgi:hypothetical protein
VPPHMASRHKVHANSIKNYIETMTDLTCMPCYCWEKLVRERGAGSGERGAGISSPNFLEF